jgi:hypothetical protein
MSTPRDARYWRERAEEVRVKGEHIRDPVAKRYMLGIARTYDHLAERADERDKGTDA